MTTSPAEPLGPDNWFAAWWLQGSPRVDTSLATDGDGEPLFSTLSLDEIGLVETVLSRTWAEDHADWQAPEAACLRSLRNLYLDRAAALRESGGSVADGRVALTIPELDQIDSDRFGWIVDELWRIEHHEHLREWLQRQIAADDFSTKAHEDVQLRRLAVTAARVQPSPESYAVLRAIYRDGATQGSVIRGDRELFERDPKFRETIEALAIHAPIEREPVYPAAIWPTDHTEGPGKEPAVTVLIPSFKHERYIEAAIHSALGQTFANTVVMVVDDDSPDRTIEKARGIEDPRLRVSANENNVGLGTSVHDALDSIETPYVALLNSDDLFHPERLARCVEVLEADPDAALVATGLDFVDGSGGRLTTDTSCVLDVGHKAHGWLLWYERVARELDNPGAWTATSSLLRHNHLATSSNMVARTDYLREHAQELSPLKYCIDWLLFLFASSDGALRYLPEPLMAYRFHDANTVWFAEGGRSQYILEVNWVIVRALRHLVAQRLSTDGPTAARSELADLLGDHVSRHGESDGLALLFTQIFDGLPMGDELTGDIDGFVRGLMERKAKTEILDLIDLPGSDVVALAENADRHHVDARVAEGFVHRSRVQEIELQKLRDDVDDHERRLREAYDQHGVIATERNAAAAERDAAAAERDAAAAERDAAAAERDELAKKHDRLSDELRERQEAWRNELQQTRAERDDLEAETLRRGERIEHLRDAVTITSSLRDAESKKASTFTHAEEWRAGQLMLHTLRLHGAWKTLRRAFTRLSVGCGRWLARPPTQRRVLLVWEGPFPANHQQHLVWEARCLLEAGLDLRVVCWERGPGEILDAADASLLAHMAVLPQDHSLAAADRRHFEQRSASDVAELLDLNDGDPAVQSRLFTMARSSATLGAGYIHAFGLGEAAALAHGTARLLGLRYGLAVEGPDLSSLYSHPSRGAVLLADAALVVADSDRTAKVLRQVSDDGLPSLTIKPPAAYWEAPRTEQTWNGKLHAAVAPAGPPWELLPVADAVSQAVHAKANLAVDMLGAAQLGSPTAEVLLPHLQARGLTAFVAFHDKAAMSLDACLDRASLMVAPSGPADEAESSIIPVEALAAMAAGLPIIATRGSILDGIIDHEQHGLLVPGGDADALTEAIQRLASDAELRQRLGHSARAKFIAEYAPAVSAAKLRDTIRALLEPQLSG